MTISQTKVSLKILPNAGKNEIMGMNNGVWRIKVAAPPDKGKANKELIDFLSRILAIRKDQITILKGQTSHNKLVEIDGLGPDEVAGRLEKGSE